MGVPPSGQDFFTVEEAPCPVRRIHRDFAVAGANGVVVRDWDEVYSRQKVCATEKEKKGEIANVRVNAALRGPLSAILNSFIGR
jgi:hypothetical protein